MDDGLQITDNKEDKHGTLVIRHPSSVLRKRIDIFRSNRRGFWSLWIFLFLFIGSLCSEIIANDKPIILKYKDEFYFPAFVMYSDKIFGGDFETEAIYRDPFTSKKIEENGWMIWPPIRFSYSTINYDLTRPAPSPPTAINILGTDDQGRDVFARLMYGFRISVLFGLILTIISSIIGIFAGAVQGYLGGWTDLLFQRFMEIWSGLPELFLLIILASLVTPNFWWLLLILLLFKWMSLTGVVRAEFLRARNFDYVKAARALGVSEPVIMLRHVLPNAMVAAMTMIPFIMSSAITALTTLDFLGFGLPIGSPSLGELLLQGKTNPDAPWLGFTGFITIAMLLVLIVFISEAVRDAFDPRKVISTGKP
ncbi:MAG: ABC transporter permease [Rickettsiales bacterium]